MASLGASLQPPLLRADLRLPRTHASQDNKIDLVSSIELLLRITTLGMDFGRSPHIRYD
ncbi:hypothetical protein VMCG_00276 [Cytospora schulzeri]|uniref:Uncharacterized protein n=1 Tax=Cytospora schulzeri TaxID=448051 RepID=A0A423XA35_9PEZI|nr:hypothetical protein VMCG_00276 [Valsa malicola]